MALFETRVRVDNLDPDDSVSPNPDITRDSEDRITEVKVTYVTIIVTYTFSWSGNDLQDDSPTRTVTER